MDRKNEKDTMNNIYTAIQALQDAQMYLEKQIDDCTEPECDGAEFTCYDCVTCYRAITNIHMAIRKIEESFSLSGAVYKVNETEKKAAEHARIFRGF